MYINIYSSCSSSITYIQYTVHILYIHYNSTYTILLLTYPRHSALCAPCLTLAGGDCPGPSAHPLRWLAGMTGRDTACHRHVESHAWQRSELGLRCYYYIVRGGVQIVVVLLLYKEFRQ